MKETKLWLWLQNVALAPCKEGVTDYIINIIFQILGKAEMKKLQIYRSNRVPAQIKK